MSVDSIDYECMYVDTNDYDDVNDYDDDIYDNINDYEYPYNYINHSDLV